MRAAMVRSRGQAEDTFKEFYGFKKLALGDHCT